MKSMTINQAMKAIKTEKCSECGRKAKGLVYSESAVNYYCKRCLHEYMENKELQTEEVAANSA